MTNRPVAMPKILIVDDVPANIQVLAKQLVDKYELLAATSGDEALRVVSNQCPDLILLDAGMPGMDGYEVLVHLKTNPETSRIPVIFVTGNDTAERESAALEAGAADFVSKPINPDVLRIRIVSQLALASARRSMQESNRQLEQMVAERTAELQEAKEAAEAANSAKTRFLGNMSHEMRTPLHQMLGLAKLMQRNPADLAKVAKWLDSMLGAGERLNALIDGVLRLTEFESGTVAVNWQPLAVQALVDAVWRMANPSAQAKGLALTREIDDIPAGLLGDPDLLNTALLCYVNNAVTYTAQGEVRVQVQVIDDDAQGVVLRFAVRDTGSGLAPEAQSRLFRLFEQGDDSSTRQFGGTGMGLFLVKKIAGGLGGDAGCESRLGEGSTFWFTVRCRRTADGGDGCAA